MIWLMCPMALFDAAFPVKQEKPHIKLVDRIWYCAGAGKISDGFTAEHAYRRWEEM